MRLQQACETLESASAHDPSGRGGLEPLDASDPGDFFKGTAFHVILPGFWRSFR
jgi:hypothetical protein